MTQSDKPVEPRPVIFYELDDTVTQQEAEAALAAANTIMENSKLPYTSYVASMGPYLHVLVLSDKQLMQSHGLPEKIGKVAVYYRQVNTLAGFLPKSTPPAPAP